MLKRLIKDALPSKEISEQASERSIFSGSIQQLYTSGGRGVR